MQQLTMEKDTLEILKKAIPEVGKLTNFSAENALQCALITQTEHMNENVRSKLNVIIGKYMK